MTSQTEERVPAPEGAPFDIEVQLTGEDGNAFAIIGAVQRALTRAGHREAAEQWRAYAMDSHSYDELLQRAIGTVNVL